MAMARVELRCEECGTEFTHRRQCYNRRDADEHEAWAASNITLCPDCYRKHRAEEHKAEQAKTICDAGFDVARLTTLTGTEKQIKWADDLRRQFIAELCGTGDLEVDDKAYSIINTASDAKFWIDSRSDSFWTIVKKISKKYEED